MTDKIFVKPAEGLKVRTHDGRRHIKPEGESVAPTNYIRRRINDGDLIEISAKSAKRAAAKAQAAEA